MLPNLGLNMVACMYGPFSSECGLAKGWDINVAKCNQDYLTSIKALLDIGSDVEEMDVDGLIKASEEMPTLLKGVFKMVEDCGPWSKESEAMKGQEDSTFMLA